MEIPELSRLRNSSVQIRKVCLGSNGSCGIQRWELRVWRFPRLAQISFNNKRSDEVEDDNHTARFRGG